MTDKFFGHQNVGASASAFNATELHVRKVLSELRTNVAVKVTAVEADPDNAGHFVLSVLPLVNQVDGLGKPTKHKEVHGIRHLNVSGGNGMATVKPKVGDMGLMAISDRDMGRAVKAKGQANPGSGRTHDMSQGVYLGGFGGMNGTPAQSIVMDENGVHLKTDKTFFVEAPNIKFTGDLRVEGKVDATGEIKAKADGGSVTLSQHIHGASPAPTPGT